tara:strand:+ start:10 stop:1335 length:1326 start_codon:yes stop_codon:yes gene_type:complete
MEEKEEVFEKEKSSEDENDFEKKKKSESAEEEKGGFFSTAAFLNGESGGGAEEEEEEEDKEEEEKKEEERRKGAFEISSSVADQKAVPAKPSPLSEDGCDHPGERSGGSRRSSTSSTTAEKKKKTTLMRNRQNSSMSLSSSSSSITRAMTPGPLSIDRPECTLRRRANVKVNAGVKETLTKLDEERREAEKRGDFEKCNELSIAMEKTKREEEKRRAALVAVHHQKAMADAIEVQRKSEVDLKRRHDCEAAKMKESFHVDAENLKAKKSERFDAFEKECNVIRAKAQKRKPKARAKELSEIRNIQAALTKQKKYVEAQEVRQKGDAIERKARNETNRGIENDLLAKKLKLKEKLEREEKQMKIKQNCCAKVLRRRHEEELVGLQRKFRGIFNELENVSKVEMREVNTNANKKTSSSSSISSSSSSAIDNGIMLRPNLHCSA